MRNRIQNPIHKLSTLGLPKFLRNIDCLIHDDCGWCFTGEEEFVCADHEDGTTDPVHALKRPLRGMFPNTHTNIFCMFLDAFEESFCKNRIDLAFSMLHDISLEHLLGTLGLWDW